MDARQASPTTAENVAAQQAVTAPSASTTAHPKHLPHNQKEGEMKADSPVGKQARNWQSLGSSTWVGCSNHGWYSTGISDRTAQSLDIITQQKTQQNPPVRPCPVCTSRDARQACHRCSTSHVISCDGTQPKLVGTPHPLCWHIPSLEQPRTPRW